MQLSLRSYWYVDWISCSLTFVLAAVGLLSIFSATQTPDQHLSLFFKKQAIGICIGMILYGVCAYTDYRTLMRWGYFGYFMLLGLLFFTLLKGTMGMGAQRWVTLFFFKFQPSELAKPLFPACVSYYLYTSQATPAQRWKSFVPLLALLAVSVLLIFKQPDLGTAIIVAVCGLTLLWCAGLPGSFFFYGGLLLALSTPLCWQLLKPYQKNRIAVFLGYGASDKERYQIEQASIAVGSGGMNGKGFLHGTQNQLKFLPESRTDFIFAVLCEEWGFRGALSFLALTLLLFMRLLFLISRMHEAYAQLLALGLLLPLMLCTLINISMVIGLLPIVGIPLPLMSYGLSNLFISCGSLGWIHGIYLQEG